MKSNKHFSIVSLAVLLALMLAAAMPFSALADDGTPPPDVPAVVDPSAEASPAPDQEQAVDPAAPVSQEATVETAPAAEQPAVEDAPAAPDLTIHEALEQLPAEASVVVVDTNGEALPLASQAAAEVVASADPYFWDGTQYVGYSPTGQCPLVVDICNPAQMPIAAAVKAFAQSQAPSGLIYIESGTYNETIEISGSYLNLSNLRGLSGENNPIINGDLYLSDLPDWFRVEGLTLNGTLFATNLSQTLDLQNVSLTAGKNSAIVIRGASGDVYLENVEASAICDGCRALDYGKGSGNVFIDGGSYASDTATAAKFDRSSGYVEIIGGDFGGGENGIIFEDYVGSAYLQDVTVGGNGFGAAFLVTGDVTIDGGDFNGTEGGGIGLMMDGDATVTNATIRYSPNGIYALEVTGTLKACQNNFFGNGVDINTDEMTGIFDDCTSITPPSKPTSNPPAGSQTPATREPGEKIVPIQTPLSLGGLLGELPQGTSFVEGVNVVLHRETDEGERLETAPHGVRITLEVPASLQGKPFHILFWNGSAWEAVNATLSADGTQVSFEVFKAGSYVLVTP